jgi:hypothetical protein
MFDFGKTRGLKNNHSLGYTIAQAENKTDDFEN